MARVNATWFLVVMLGWGNLAPAQGQWSGQLASEARLFADSPAHPGQGAGSLSLVLQPEYYRSWDEGRQSFLFAPFLRLDSRDPERSHGDIRELSWIRASRDWELRLGIRKVFWGVTESQHLVDILNQTDLVENPDGEDKLGQPMVNLALVREWGTLDLFLLPGFRERTFPGIEGRLRPALVVDTDQAVYESSREERRIDAALRWSHYIGPWDLGLSHFHGTSREPRLLPGVNSGGQPVLVPHYDVIHQTGLALQRIAGDWLWKLELIRRSGQNDTFTAAVGGFEYTLVGLRESVVDLGLLLEYSFDDRKDTAPNPFGNDLFLGTRWVFNDVDGTEILAGLFLDLDHHGRLYNLEASRRIGNAWRLSAELRVWQAFPITDPLHAFQADDHLLVELARYF
ncbi:MAG TPA: hypothetical protein VIQ75_00055 [Gammaproteobacteria bacterium]